MASVRDQRQRSHAGACAQNDSITIGLINNMPDAALRSTELQFRAVLASAAQNFSIDLRLFMLPERPRGEADRARLVQGYEDLSDLWPSRVDGLIVTGAEPQAVSLQQEPVLAYSDQSYRMGRRSYCLDDLVVSCSARGSALPRRCGAAPT